MSGKAGCSGCTHNDGTEMFTGELTVYCTRYGKFRKFVEGIGECLSEYKEEQPRIADVIGKLTRLADNCDETGADYRMLESRAYRHAISLLKGDDRK